MIIFKGKQAICGILLTIDKVWRYRMQDSEELTVKIVDKEGTVITKVYTSADVDDVDKFITVELSPEETATMSTGRGTITAYMNDLVALRPTEFFVKEAI